MIVFYGWTFLQILNMINVKDHYFKDEKAILLIAGYENTERYQEMLDESVKRGVFCKAEKLIFSVSGGGIRSLLRRKKEYDSVIERLIPPCKVKCVTAGFWGDSLLVMDCLHRKYDLREIGIVEEGILFPDKCTLFQKVPLIKRIFYGGLYYKRFIGMIKETYTYGGVENKLAAISRQRLLPKIDMENTNCIELLQRHRALHAPYINEYHVFYFDGNHRINHFDLLAEFYRTVFSVLHQHHRKISVRLHPSNKTRKPLFDGIADQIDDMPRTVEELSVCGQWNEKIILTVNSASAVNMNRVFGANPYVIYINRLYEDMEVPMPPVIIDNQKNFMPETMEEYCAIIKKITGCGEVCYGTAE